MRDHLPQIAPQLRLGGWRNLSTFRALRHRNFRLFWFGQMVSLIGTWMQSTAQQWLVYRLTDSPLSLGQVSFAAFVPVLFLSLPAGVLVDRVEKRRLIVLAQAWFLVLAGILAVLTATGAVRYWHVVLLALLLGLGNALDMPARQAFVVEMVGKEDLMNAIALNSSVFNGARIVGPAIAGLVVAAVGESLAFAANAVSYVAVIVGLLAMRLPGVERSGDAASAVSQMRDGLRYIRGHRTIFGLVGLVAVMSAFGFPVTTLVAVFARDRLGIGAEGFGLLMSSLGVGALIGALLLATLGNLKHKGRLMAAAMFVFNGAMAVFGASPFTLLSMAALVAAGWAMITQLASANTLVQTLVPDELRGRVISTYTWTLGGFLPIGSLFIGATAERLGAPTAVLINAGISAVMGLVLLLAFPEVRRA